MDFFSFLETPSWSLTSTPAKNAKEHLYVQPPKSVFIVTVSRFRWYCHSASFPFFVVGFSFLLVLILKVFFFFFYMVLCGRGHFFITARSGDPLAAPWFSSSKHQGPFRVEGYRVWVRLFLSCGFTVYLGADKTATLNFTSDHKATLRVQRNQFRFSSCIKELESERLLCCLPVDVMHLWLEQQLSTIIWTQITQMFGQV